MYHKKIDAFTLTEMLVVLVVSSIVIAITFMVLNLVQKQVLSIRTNFSKQQEIQTLERLLWQDFNTYDVYYNQFDDTLECNNHTNTILYTFNSDYVVRENDTLRVTINDKKLFLDGNTVTNNTVDAITLFTEKLYANNKIFVYKPKSADYYLNN